MRPKSVVRGIVFVALAVFAGCAPRYVTRTLATGRVVAPGPSLPFALAIDDISWTTDGAGENVGPAFHERVAGAIRAAQIFTAVHQPRDAFRAAPDSAHLRVEVVSTLDRHEQANAVKGILTGLTVLVLAPFVQLEMDHAQTIRAVLRLPSGETRQYDVSSSMGVRADAFRFQSSTEILHGRILQANLVALVAQMQADLLASPPSA